jgi:signal transduction histidine kinase
MILSLVILLVGAYVIGSYVSSEIEHRVINRTSALTALYVDSVVSPHLQELSRGHDIGPQHLAELDQLVVDSALGEGIPSFKVWHSDGDIVWAKNGNLIGRRFPIGGDLEEALDGKIESHMSNLDDDENVFERASWDHLLETYAPVRQDETGEIIGAVEFYQDPGALEAEIGRSQRDGWLIVGGSTAIMYVLLVGMVRGASTTISRQHGRLDSLARRNAALAERVRRAADRKSETDELMLRRIAQDLHDGPAQDVGLVLLRLDSLKADIAQKGTNEDVELMRSALGSALQEIRLISAGLRLPEMDDTDLAGVIKKAVQDFRSKTGDNVRITLDERLPEVGLPVKIALYRVTQEALNNAHHHARVSEVSVSAVVSGNTLILQVIDSGTGIADRRGDAEETPGRFLGIRGMRERIELLGGTLEVLSSEGAGTVVRATLPLGEVV